MRNSRKCISSAAGMTLLEVMVAVALTAVAGLIAFAAIQSASEHSQHMQQRNKALKQLDNAVYWLVTDIRRTVPLPLPVNDEKSAAIYAESIGELRLSVRGFDALAYSKSALSQIEYQLQEGRLLRTRLPALMNMQSNEDKEEPFGEVLLEDIQKFEVRFLDAGTAKLKEWPMVDRWSRQWPARGMSSNALPWAIWVSIEGEQIGRIERLVEVPGGARD